MVALMVTFSAEFYVLIVFMNSVVMLILVQNTYDFSLWFVLFETTMLTTFTALSIENRSYRRIYAFLVMFLSTCVSTTLFYLLLNNSNDLQSSWLVLFMATAVIAIKTPAFPFSLWLPEAHVEAS